MPQLPQQWNGSAAQASLAPVASSPEYVIPLWWYSGAVYNCPGLSSANPSYMVSKGQTSYGAATKLHTLNANWLATTLFAFELSMYCSATLTTAFAALWDITVGAMISASQVYTTSKTPTVIRSAQFTLTPGHTYGIVTWGSTSTNVSALTDASLIVFPS